MEFYELMENIEKTYEEKESLTPEELAVAETELINIISPELLCIEIQHTKPGKYTKIGKVVGLRNEETSFESFGLNVGFDDGVRTFIFKPLIATSHFNKILNEEVFNKCVKVCEVHNALIAKYNVYKNEQRKLALEAEKKAAEAKKAEEKYNKMKENAVKDFNRLVKQSTGALSDIDDFYFAIGWLAKNVGTVSAAMPDYLLSSFERHFGKGHNPRVQDSTKRTVNGLPSQWALSMTASIKKNDLENIPTILTPHLNTAGKSIADTSFVWDLVDNYGFKFGKTQDLDQIKRTIPAKYHPSFEAGLA
jgi:hypothetical protein